MGILIHCCSGEMGVNTGFVINYIAINSKSNMEKFDHDELIWALNDAASKIDECQKLVAKIANELKRREKV